MRATGFGHKSPREATGDYVYPLINKDGKSLDYNNRTITEQRRELLYLHKLSARSNVNPFRASLDTIKDELEPTQSPMNGSDAKADLIAKVHAIQKRPFSGNQYGPVLNRNFTSPGNSLLQYNCKFQSRMNSYMKSNLKD